MASIDAELLGNTQIDPDIAGFSTHAFREFNRIRNAGQLCDITIISNGRQLNAHRVVLAATIPYFHTMFTCGLNETKQSKIYLDGHDANMLELIINYSYTGTIKLTDENIFLITNLAAYMQISRLMLKCQEYLCSICSTSNIFQILELGVLYDNQRIIEAASRFLRLNFYSCSHSPEFLKLNLETVCAITENDELHVDSEEQILDAVLRWLNHDLKKRLISAPKVLGHVRLAIVKLQSLIEAMENPAIQKSPQCRKMFEAAMHYHTTPEERVIMPSMIKNSRKCSDVPGVIYALGGLTSSSRSAVEFFDPLANQWIPSGEMLSVRTRFGVAVHKRELYAIGGSDGISRFRTVEMFDVNTNTWKKKPDLLYPRSAMATSIIKETIYVCGGYNGTDSLSSVEAYRPEWRCWITRPAMQIPRCAAAAAVVCDKIFVLGGHNAAAIYNSTEVFDITDNTWTTGINLLNPRCRHGATTLDNQIYIAGGYDGSQFLNTVHMYDLEKNEWFPIASMNMRRSRVSLVTTDNLLYVIGGHDGKSNISSIEVYDPREDKWHFGPSMKLHEGGVSAGVIPVSSTFITR